MIRINYCGKLVDKEKNNIIFNSSFRKEMLIGLLAMGIKLEDKHLDSFCKYLELIQSWQKKSNITAAKDSFDIIYKHFLDSLSGIRLINKEIKKNKKTKIIDIGSGAGFPGIPVKIILPKIEMTLLEARKNKKEFLDNTVKEIDLDNVYVLRDRAENLGKIKEYREKYNIVLSRAVASLEILSEYCLPLCKTGGIMLAFKGSSFLKELEISYKVIEKLGGLLESINLIKVPHSEHIRCILAIRKIAITPENYPRRNGIPQKRPLCF